MTYTVIFALPGDDADTAVTQLVGRPTPADALLDLLQLLRPGMPVRIEPRPDARVLEVLLAHADDDLVPLPAYLPDLVAALHVLRHPRQPGIKA